MEFGGFEWDRGNRDKSRFKHGVLPEETDFSHKNRLEFVYQPPVKSISIRLPQPLLTELKRVAARMDVAYQALIKMWLSEKVKEIRHS